MTVLLTLALPCQGGVAARISTEQLEDHSLTKTLHRFAELVASRSNGLVLFTVHSEGRLYTDNEAPRMVSLGRVDMAVTACNMLEAFDPSFSVLTLPSFFDTPCAAEILLDGPLGRALSASLEKRLNVVVLGRPLARSAPLLFGVGERLDSFDDLAGRQVRISGGLGHQLRLELLGARPMAAAVSDLVQMLREGRVQALLGTPELVCQMRLWRYGVTGGLDVGHSLLSYVPMVSRQFWDRLAPPLRELVRACWEEIVPAQRLEAFENAVRVRAVLQEQGVPLRRPPGEAVDRVRRELLAAEDAMAERIGVDRSMLLLAREAARSCRRDAP